MTEYTKPYDDVLSELGTNKTTGLNDEQVNESRMKFGTNEFSSAPSVPLIKRILDALMEPMVLILVISAIITISINLIKYFNGGHASFTESIAILAAIAISSGITVIMEGRSEKAFEKLKSINEDISVKVFRKGHIIKVPVKNIVKGDIIRIESGDKVPADARLIDSLQLKIDESLLTGESVPVSKDTEFNISEDDTPIADRKNMIYNGTFVTYGYGSAVVTSIGDNTEMGKIAGELKRTDRKLTPLQEKLGQFGKTISLVGFLTAAVIFIIRLIKIFMTNSFTFDAIQNAFMTSIALIVAAVPEGLPTIIAMTLSINVIKMAKNNALVRKIAACETIGCINVICSDKTGTLTKNKMTVIDVYNDGNLLKPEKIKSVELMENFCVNSTANLQKDIGKVNFIGNPTECALLMAFNEKMLNNYIDLCRENITDRDNNIRMGIKDYRDLRKNANILYRYPFSSDRKYMTTVISKNKRPVVYTKGSPEKILEFSKYILKDNKVQLLTKDIKNSIREEIMKLEGESKRILAFSHKEANSNTDWSKDKISVENDMIFDGFVSIEDPLRDDVYVAIKKCRKSGIMLKMLTGDNILTAKSIAEKLDITNEKSIVLQAADIDKMTDSELEAKLDNITVIARSNPITKMRVVRALKKMGNVVAVTGDGINDVPALKNADVGISMGLTGSEVSKEASDIVLLDDSFSTIVHAVEWGRGIYENFQRFIQFQLTVNLVAMIVTFLAEILGYDIPFTTLQLLWVNIIMDGPPALSLGLESLRSDLMDRKPIKRNENIISHHMFFQILLNGVFIIVLLMMLITNNILHAGSAAEKSTVVFTAFVLFQIFNAFNSREVDNSSVFENLLGNRIMLITILFTFAVQFLITQFGGSIFHTVPLKIDMWLKIIAYTISVILFSEAVHFVMRKLFKKKQKNN